MTAWAPTGQGGTCPPLEFPAYIALNYLWWPMVIVPTFYHIHRRSGAKIVADSGHLEVKNCTKNLFALGLSPGPRWEACSAPPEPLASGEGLAVLPKNATPPNWHSGLSSPFGLPWKKIMRAPTDDCETSHPSKIHRNLLTTSCVILKIFWISLVS